MGLNEVPRNSVIWLVMKKGGGESSLQLVSRDRARTIAGRHMAN